jgi:hypothetical protein
MARPRVRRSIEWRTPEGDRLKTPPFFLAPVLSQQWTGEEIETVEEYDTRVTSFVERREHAFARVDDARRNREARANRTREKIERDRENARRRRQNRTYDQREQERTRLRQLEAVRAPRVKPLRPFIGVDGEGAGTDGIGRQYYVYMSASNADASYVRELRHINRGLTTRDCLDFILSMPARAILVGYFFRYDVNQILRGMIKQQNTLRRIVKNPYYGKGGPAPTFWGDYAITYQENQYFRVAKLGEDRKIIKGSSRTVYEPFRFFQCSFSEALKKFEIGDEAERQAIEEMKKLREEFTELTPKIENYCKDESLKLAMLMEKFRNTCYDACIKPQRWSGPGWLAADVFEQYGIPKRPLTAGEHAKAQQRDIEAEERRVTTGKPRAGRKEPTPRRPERDPEFEAAACSAYYGGRFETNTHGFITIPVYQYDLKSAYPANMRGLPCPFHTHWEHLPHATRLPRSGIYLADVTFQHRPNTLLCGLPVRHQKPPHHLTWPLDGRGRYWSPEIDAVKRCLNARIKVHDLWVARRRCNCDLYIPMVEYLYAKRQEHGSERQGAPFKLALNSMYGKLAQRRTGQAPYWDPVAAGLITSRTRAQLIEAVSHDPEAVIKIATDAVFSTRPLPLDIGESLGQWGMNTYPDFFIAKPGVYWSPSDRGNTVKSRGAPRSTVGKAAAEFERVFAEYFDKLQDPVFVDYMLLERLIPRVPLKLTIFNSCRRAFARCKPEVAGKWEEFESDQSFDWALKRDPMKIIIGDRHIKTFPQKGSILIESFGYAPPDFDADPNVYHREHAEELDAETIDEVTDGMPDYDEWNEYAKD